jgi:hypothetical protein
MSPDQAATYFRGVSARAAESKPPTEALPAAGTALAAQVRTQAAERGLRAAVTTTQGATHTRVTVVVPRGYGRQAQDLVALAATQQRAVLAAQVHQEAATAAARMVGR